LQAHEFYERHGGVTIVIARFMPFVRTFAPFVAGVAQMTRRKFTFFDVTGGGLWVGGIITLGYFFGNIPWVKDNLSRIIWAMIIIPGVLALYGSWRARRKAQAQVA
ncbi:MAG: VTT domain-containing protein, partial [Burkholderiales bacterium]